MTQSPVLEFSYPIEIGRVATKGFTLKIAANAEQCLAIAKRAGLPKLQSLAADLHLQFIPQTDVLEIHGMVDAVYDQNCVITDQILHQHLRFEFTVQCMDIDKIEKSASDPAKEAELIDEGFEPIIHNMFDVGELVVQQLMVHIDPYPRAENADLQRHLQEIGHKSHSPFDVLKQLKKG